MFGLLKDKLKSFASALVRKKEAEPAPAAPVEAVPEKPVEIPKVIEKPVEKLEEPRSVPPIEPQMPTKPKGPPKMPKPRPGPEQPTSVPLEVAPTHVPEKPSEKAEKPRALAPRLTIGTKLRALVSPTVAIKEADVAGLLDELERGMLESDVAYEVMQAMIEDLRKRLVGMSVPKGQIQNAIMAAIRDSLADVLEQPAPDIFAMVAEKKAAGQPAVILFLGPNGAGKTTTIAKVARALMDRGYTCVLSASDTFRAAAIEQTEHHAGALGLRAIKHKYGSDPAAVAFDAIAHARAHGINAVLIDSAGRQETNYNLLDEMAKIVRVAKPDLKIFIGEAIAGNALVSQVQTFKEKVGLDGVILTKLDVDAKGGTALSVARATGVPILFFGTGQAYADLVPFDKRFVLDNLVPT